MKHRLDDCLRLYQVEHAKPNRCDLKRIKYAEAALLRALGADRDVATLKRADARAYREARQAEGASDSTIRREINGVLKAALRHAWKEERIAAVPFLDAPPESAPRERWFTEAEVTRIFEQPMNERTRLFLYVAFGTGARKTAIATVPVKRVDVANGYIDFRDPALKVTKKRRVKVKIADFLLPIIKEAITGKKPDDLLIGEGGDIGPHVKRVLRAAGIDERGVAAHAFRKTFVNWSLLNGAEPARVAAAVGDRLATLERNYLNALPQHTAGAVNAAVQPPK